MQTITITNERDDIRELVKEETSIIAKRRPAPPPLPHETTLQREELFNDLLILDEENETMFNRLFQEAHAEVISRVNAKFIKETTTDVGDGDGNSVIILNMPDEWPIQYERSVGFKVRQFIVDYIVWRWLEGKSPGDAAMYFSRLDETVKDIQGLLNRWGRPLRRIPSFP
jgi:hypothetical protein